MNCKCLDTPDAFYYDDAPQEFLQSLRKVAAGNWIALYCCGECGQHWSIDAWDKYTDRVVIRVHKVDSWENQDTTELRKKLLLEARGGTTNEKCSWARCTQPRVKEAMFCINHLYETGARK